MIFIFFNLTLTSFYNNNFLNMRKNIFLLILFFLIISSCAKDESGYSLVRKYFVNSFITKRGAELKTAGKPDQNAIGTNGKKLESAYYAIISGELTDVEDTIIQYGHCWSTDPKNQNPFINVRDTSTWSRLLNEKQGEIAEPGLFTSRISNLFPETPFYVRSYVITSKGDTGYNKVVFIDTTLAPVNEWFQKADFGTGTVTMAGREGAVAFVMYNSTKKYECAYVFGGFEGLSCKRDFFEYDPVSNTWQQINTTNPTIPRTDAVGFSITYFDEYGNKVIRAYVGLGADTQGNTLSDWWEYVPEFNTWRQKTNLPYVLGLRGAVSFVIGEKGYVGTGTNTSDIELADFYSYNPKADTTNGTPWVSISKFGNNNTYARKEAIAFVIDGYAFVGMGEKDGNYFNDMWLFVPGDDVQSYGFWLKKTGLPDTVPGRSQAVGFAIETQGYVGCGFDGTNSLQDFWRYDPYNDRWYECADYKTGPVIGEPQYIRNAIGFGIENKGYVGLGYKSANEIDSKYSYELWVYRPW